MGLPRFRLPSMFEAFALLQWDYGRLHEYLCMHVSRVSQRRKNMAEIDNEEIAE